MKRSDVIAEIVRDAGALRRVMFACHGGIGRPSSNMPTRAQAGVLFHLHREGERHPKELADRLCMTPGAATQLVNGLMKAGFVLRVTDPKDRRRVRLTLSPKGARAIAAIERFHEQAYAKFLAPLTDAELRTWNRLQKKLVQSREVSTL